jgi:hypothetical protein
MNCHKEEGIVGGGGGGGGGGVGGGGDCSSLPLQPLEQVLPRSILHADAAAHGLNEAVDTRKQLVLMLRHIALVQQDEV